MHVLNFQAAGDDQPAARMNRIRFYCPRSQLTQAANFECMWKFSGNRPIQKKELARQSGWSKHRFNLEKKCARGSRTIIEAFTYGSIVLLDIQSMYARALRFFYDLDSVSKLKSQAY